MEPIHYGDVVGLCHPGTNSRIARDKGQEFLQFTVLGGTTGTVVPTGGVVTLAQDPPGQYYLLSSNDKWRVTIERTPFSKDGPVHSGARVRLEAVPAGSREYQLYIIYKTHKDPIEHVVLLMMENRSFFRVFGYLDPKKDTYVNYSQSGKAFRSAPSEDLETPDPPHEIPFVNISLEGEKHDGYVKAYEKYHHELGSKITDEDLQDVMGYTQKGFLPALHKMADFASICSQWYCSMRGPTWSNRMFALSGTCFNWRTTPEMNPNILNDLKDFLVDWHAFKPVYPQRFSIFDILKERNVSYNIYTDTPLEFTLSGDVFYPAEHDDDMDEFRKHAKDGTLPHFSFVEPNFVHMPKFGFIQNDDHPPASPLKAQRFIADVYESLRTSPKWKNTLLVVTYDEHGGFFDPVIPPVAPVPDAVSADEQRTFGTFGVRVPTVLVSPCVKHGIDDAVYDHTSVLKYVLQKWAPEGVNQLGERVKHANTLPVLAVPRTDEFPPITDEDFQVLKDHRVANNKIDDEAPNGKLPLHESAALALQDPEVEHSLRKLIIDKRLAKDTNGAEKATATVAATIVQVELAQQQEIAKQKEEREREAERKKHNESVITHVVHDIKEAGHAIETAFSSLFHHGNSSAKPSTQLHAQATAKPLAPSLDSTAQVLATVIIKEAALEDAERYADDIIRKILQGADAQEESDTQKCQDILANQIRAMSMSADKEQGSNDLARTYLQLMQLRAKKHARKIDSKSKPVALIGVN